MVAVDYRSAPRTVLKTFDMICANTKCAISCATHAQNTKQSTHRRSASVALVLRAHRCAPVVEMAHTGDELSHVHSLQK